jgi:hypothetical protein
VGAGVPTGREARKAGVFFGLDELLSIVLHCSVQTE